MPAFSAEVDDSRLVLRLRNGSKRLAFAVANGINNTAKAIQKIERDRLSGRFTLRGGSTQFLQRQAAIIRPFASATRNRAFAEISVGQRRRLLLPKYEERFRRTPFKGKQLAVPVLGSPTRRTKQSSVPEELTFQKLRLRKQKRAPARRRRGDPNNRPRQGLQRTYTVPGVGVFQRRSGGRPGVGFKGGSRRSRHNSVLIYAFIDPPQVDARPGLTETANRVAPRLLRENIQREVRETLTRAGRT